MSDRKHEKLAGYEGPNPVLQFITQSRLFLRNTAQNPVELVRNQQIGRMHGFAQQYFDELLPFLRAQEDKMIGLAGKGKTFRYQDSETGFMYEFVEKDGSFNFSISNPLEISDSEQAAEVRRSTSVIVNEKRTSIHLEKVLGLRVNGSVVGTLSLQYDPITGFPAFRLSESQGSGAMFDDTRTSSRSIPQPLNVVFLYQKEALPTTLQANTMYIRRSQNGGSIIRLSLSQFPHEFHVHDLVPEEMAVLMKGLVDSAKIRRRSRL